MSTNCRNRRGLIWTGIVLLAFCLANGAALAEDRVSEASLSTPEEAYDAVKAAVEADDVEALKALMSAKLKERLKYEFYYTETLSDGKEYLEKVPKTKATITDGEAAISRTYDEEKVIATYSWLFLEENGRWMFHGFKISTRSK